MKGLERDPDVRWRTVKRMLNEFEEAAVRKRKS
jgi:hypothetical protein